MKIKKEIEFNKIISDILKNEIFINLGNEIHHGVTRLEHSLNVARTAYNWAKKLKWDNYEEITRAALLHDFFFSDDIKDCNQLHHQTIAARNAIKYFNINSKQQNIIAAHMFPLTKTMPKYKESWLVSFADKYCAIKECAKYKMPLATGTCTLFIINFLAIQR